MVQRAQSGMTPGPVEGPELTLRPQDRFVEAAHRILRRHFARMLWHEPGTRLGADPERLHDMRVAVRRLRAVLRLCRGAIPRQRESALARELRWLGGVLGRVRDLDVHLLRIAEERAAVAAELQPALALYERHLHDLHLRERRALLRALDGRRYARLVALLHRFLEAGPPPGGGCKAADEPAAVRAAALIRRRLRRVLRDGRALSPNAPSTALHRLRIDCKRLRYACEFFADLFGAPAAEFARRVTRIQDVLGEHQDAVVAGQMLDRFAAGVRGSARRMEELHAALGQLDRVHAQAAARARAEFFRAWGRFDRPSVRRAFKRRLRARSARA